MRLGCNYWASNAGADMWVQWDPDTIRKDLTVLKAHGVQMMRVFPNWRDFQPVEALYSAAGTLREYRMAGDRNPENSYYLSECMLDRFGTFLDLCQEFELQLVVGLLTGWMSSRLFIPTALMGKNLYTDPTCLYFEQLFVEGFVKRFRNHPAIYAWDHGNECDCLATPDGWAGAEAWAHLISNAVYAQDRTHPLITGIHNMSLSGNWRIAGQAAACDILVSHPYPYWSRLAKNDATNAMRTTLYPMALTQIYRDIAGKPCIMEEIGSMGPSVCSEDRAADFLNALFFTSIANGNDTILWWCSHDQDLLINPPYTWTTCENELGMTDHNRVPKPVLKKMGELAALSEQLPLPLPSVQADGVCILTQDQDEMGVGFMTYALGKQAGLNFTFADGEKPLPESDLYLLPSVAGARILPKERYWELLERVSKGATLYISHDGGILLGFEQLTGNRIVDTHAGHREGTIELDGKTIPYTTNLQLELTPVRAQNVQSPLITRSDYGKGQVFFVNFPVESMLIDGSNRLEEGTYQVYRTLFAEILATHPVRVEDPSIALTLHPAKDRIYAVAINHAKTARPIAFETSLGAPRILYGNLDQVQPMDAVVAEFVVS